MYKCPPGEAPFPPNRGGLCGQFCQLNSGPGSPSPALLFLAIAGYDSSQRLGYELPAPSLS